MTLGPAFSWLLAFRYLLSRWVNVLGMTGVAVAVWALIVVRAIFSGFLADIESDVRRNSSDLLVTSLPYDTSYQRIAEVLRGDGDVLALAPRLRHYGVFYQRSRLSRAQSAELEFSNVDSNYVQLLGIDPALEPAVVPFQQWRERAGGTWPGDEPDGLLALGPELQVPDELEWRARRRARLPVPETADAWRSQWPGLLLGRRRARLQHFLQAGDPFDVVSVDFAGPTAGADAGAVRTLHRTFAFAGAFDTGGRLFDEVTALVPIEALRTMLGHHALDELSVDLVTDVALRVRAGLDERQLRQIAARLEPLVAAVLPPGARPEVVTWREQNKVYLDAVEHERAMMGAVLFAVMLIAGFLIFATLHVMVTQKTKDIGILTALGGSPRGVGAVFTRCGMVIGVVGCCSGAALGVLSLWYLNPVNDWMSATFGVELFSRALFDLPQIPYRIEAGWVLLVVAAAFALTLLVAWLPARKAAHMHPVQALAFE